LKLIVPVPEVVSVPPEEKLVATLSVHPPLKITCARAAVPLNVIDQDNVTVAHEPIVRAAFRLDVALHAIDTDHADSVQLT
jgi:hypothetical protein